LSPALAIPVFAVSAVLTLAAAGFFADKLDHVGPRLGLPESAVGLLTAVAADTPEIASAVVALVAGDKEASLGVVLGSNVFNLAAMIGLSAVLAGAVTIGRRALVVEGAVSALCLAITAALVLGVLSAPLALILFLVIAVPYVIFTLRRPHEPHQGSGSGHHVRGEAVLKEILLMIPAVAVIVLGSTGMVKAALALADRWNVSETVTGLLVLAVLTSLPNAFTAVRLGLGGRGDALVTEALASNTINLTGGILVPALFVGLASATTSVKLDFAWLAGMTLFALLALATSRGMGRIAGAVLIAMYLTFVVLHLVSA
jgi:cation:H+ antiporter